MAKYILTVVLVAASLLTFASKEGETVTINGKVTEVIEGKSQPVAMAYVYINNSIFTSYTNDKGEFQLEVPAEKVEISASFKGYSANALKVNAKKENSISIILTKE